ncbi:MAG: ATP synthase F1 subunit delta [Firmicutes bacterium]|nr:ATP synthase F1 subunit delta [Bacillota bacterium]
MSQSRTARSYAEAIFSTAQKLGQENEIGLKLTSLKQRLKEDAEWRRILHHKLLTPEEKEKALKTLIPQLLNRTVEDTIIATIEEYQTLLDKAKNRELVEITAAAPLSPSLTSELETRLGELIGKKIRIQIKIDPKIVGGLVIHWGDQVVDASVKRKLESIGAHLKTI